MTATPKEIAKRIKAGRYDQARKDLEATAENEENRFDLEFLRGHLLDSMYDREGALATYESLLDQNPDHDEATFHAALLSDLGGADEAAIDLYERCVEREPIYVNALLNLGVLYEQKGRYVDAERCFRSVLAEHPNHKRARHYLRSVEASYTMVYDEKSQRERDQRSAVLDLPITDFELSVRSRNCLRQMNIKTLGDLLRISEVELLSFKNFGETSLNEIKAMLSQKGLRIGQLTQAAAEQADTPTEVVENTVAPELSRSVSDLELSVRSRKCLQRLGITIIGDLTARTEFRSDIAGRNQTTTGHLRAFLEGAIMTESQIARGGGEAAQPDPPDSVYA